jgi:hypothetical protein
MTHRCRFAILSLVAVAVVVAAWVWLFWPRTAITLENARKIRPGMTLAEVEAILGRPERDEFQFGMLVVNPVPGGDLLNPGWVPGCHRRWTSRQASVGVFFDADDRVFDRHYGLVPLFNSDMEDKLRAWFGLPQRTGWPSPRYRAERAPLPPPFPCNPSAIPFKPRRYLAAEFNFICGDSFLLQGRKRLGVAMQ